MNRNLIRLFALLLLTVTTQFAYAGAHSSNKRPVVTVSAEKQAELQSWLDDFTFKMDDKYFGQVGSLNGALEFEDRTFETEWAKFEVRVTRGDVVEKTGRMYSVGKKLSPGRGEGILTWGRFYSLDMHPKSPLVGMLHATIVMQMFEDNSVVTGGWLGVMPGTKVEEDLALLKKVTDDYFERHGKDPSLYRTLICKGTHDTKAEFRRKPACSGVSFYGPPVYRGDSEASIKFIAGLYEEFVAAYMATVEARADDPVTAEDLAAQAHMRRSWLIDQLFSDPFAAKIIPFKIWSFANVAPTVKF